MKGSALLRGSGTSILLTLSYTTVLLSPNHFAIFFHRLPVSSVYVGMLIELVALSLAAALVWYFIAKVKDDSTFWALGIPAIVVFEAHSISKFWNLSASHRFWGELGVLTMLVSLALRWKKRAYYNLTVRGVCASVALAGFSIFWILPELAYVAIRTSSPEAPSLDAGAGAAAAAGPRMVWIIFDELSQDQVFDHRWPDLSLPNFDRLRARSITYNNVEPAGDYTRVVIPSLLLGRPISRVTAAVNGQLTPYFDDTHKWENFDSSRTIVADARRLGWTSGIVGWSYPFCRSLQNWVESCYWVSDDFPIIDGTDASPDRTSLQNAFSLLNGSFNYLFRGISWSRNAGQANWVADRQRKYELVLQHALDLARNPSIRFAILHFPAPHPPAFYDRKTRAFSVGGSYVDNLAITDAALGEVLGAVENTPARDQTTVIVSGDHSWRTWIWNEYFWTREDQAASRGIFDPRPVLMIHLPGQSQPIAYTPSIKGLGIHRVLSAVLHGWIHSPEDAISQMRQALVTH